MDDYCRKNNHRPLEGSDGIADPNEGLNCNLLNCMEQGGGPTIPETGPELANNSTMRARFVEENITVGVLRCLVEVEAAVRKLRESHFDMKRVSVACHNDYAPDEIAGFYHEGGQMQYWGKSRACWQALWQELPGWGFFVMPGVGPVLIGGPLALWIVTVLENSSIFGGLSALGAALHTVGASRSSIAEYEAALKSGLCLVLVYGSANEVSRGKQILSSLGNFGAKNVRAS